VIYLSVVPETSSLLAKLKIKENLKKETFLNYFFVSFSFVQKNYLSGKPRRGKKLFPVNCLELSKQLLEKFCQLQEKSALFLFLRIFS